MGYFTVEIRSTGFWRKTETKTLQLGSSTYEIQLYTIDPGGFIDTKLKNIQPHKATLEIDKDETS